MNDETKDGGPAFPVPNDANVNDQEGMTLRDYFAAKAISFAAELELQYPTGEHAGGSYEGVASRAYLLADAMLAAREAKS
jgi:hypothetical protein